MAATASFRPDERHLQPDQVPVFEGDDELRCPVDLFEHHGVRPHGGDADAVVAGPDRDAGQGLPVGKAKLDDTGRADGGGDAQDEDRLAVLAGGQRPAEDDGAVGREQSLRDIADLRTVGEILVADQCPVGEGMDVSSDLTGRRTGRHHDVRRLIE